MNASFKNLGSFVLKPTSNYIKKFDASFFMGMHNHEYIEIMYAKKGNFDIEFFEDPVLMTSLFTVTVNQGSLIFLDSSIFHRLKVNSETVIYNVELKPTTADRYNPFDVNSVFPINYKALISKTNLSLLANRPYTIVPDLSNVENAMRNLIFALSKEPNKLEDALSTQVSLFSLFNEISKSLAILKDNDTFFTKKTYIYIKNHLSQNLTLESIANAMQYHKSYLTTQFKKLTGKSVMQLVSSLRISKSLQLLRETNLSVDQIATQVGFSNYNQMFYAFKKHVGIPPTECRQHFINDEIAHINPEHQSKSVRVSLEDYIFDDDEFYSAYYKPEIASFADETLKSPHGLVKANVIKEGDKNI